MSVGSSFFDLSRTRGGYASSASSSSAQLERGGDFPRLGGTSHPSPLFDQEIENLSPFDSFYSNATSTSAVDFNSSFFTSDLFDRQELSSSPGASTGRSFSPTVQPQFQFHDMSGTGAMSGREGMHPARRHSAPSLQATKQMGLVHAMQHQSQQQQQQQQQYPTRHPALSQHQFLLQQHQQHQQIAEIKRQLEAKQKQQLQIQQQMRMQQQYLQQQHHMQQHERHSFDHSRAQYDQKPSDYSSSFTAQPWSMLIQMQVQSYDWSRGIALR